MPKTGHGRMQWAVEITQGEHEHFLSLWPTKAEAAEALAVVLTYSNVQAARVVRVKVIS